MKKYLIVLLVEIFLVVVLAISIHFNYCFWNSVSDLNKLIEMYTDSIDYDYTMVIQGLKESVKTNTNYAILSLTSSLLILASIILIAIKDFPVFQPFRDKIKARQEQRAQAKAEKAEAKKQELIKDLEATLEELKND